MAESRHGARRAGAVALGLMLAVGSVLWGLFWLYGLAWVGTPDLGAGLFLGVCFALGIVGCICGVALMAGSKPSRRAWLLVAVAAATPLVVLAFVGVSTSRHAEDVDELAVAALSQRTGAANVTAACVWEYDQDSSELWRCAVSSARGDDTCFVWFTERSGDEVIEVDRCEGGEAVVAEAVSDAYKGRRGVEKDAELCGREIDGPGSTELWRCELVPARDDGYCWADVGWRPGGRVTVAIRHCERELSAAVVNAYRTRRGRSSERARCTENDQDDGEWVCDLGVAGDREACIVYFTPARAVTSARIAYCEREVVARVEEAVERTYEKRTRFDDVTAACTLSEHEEWDCSISLPSGRDRCEVAIDMRPQGPKVDFVFTSCRSGRI